MLTTPLFLLGFLLCSLLSLLLIPVGPLRAVAVSVAGLARNDAGKIVVLVVCFLLFVFLMDGCWDCYSLAATVQQARDAGTAIAFSSTQEALLYQAQIQALVCALDLFAVLSIWRIAELSRDNERAAKSAMALKKQAEGLQAAYKSLQDGEEISKPKGDAGKKTDGASRLKDLEAEVSSLKKAARLAEDAKEEAEAKCKTAEAGAAAIKKQAENTSKEYERLLEENESLKDQLVDMDEATVVDRKSK